MAKDEVLNELVSNHNDLCDLLDSLDLNPLADFESFKVEEIDFEPEDEPEDESEVDLNGTGF